MVLPNSELSKRIEMMEQTVKRGAWTTGAKVAGTLLAGLVVLVLLFPGSGVDTLPPQCFSVFNYSVPCGTGLSFAAGAATAGIVGLALLAIRERPSSAPADT